MTTSNPSAAPADRPGALRTGSTRAPREPGTTGGSRAIAPRRGGARGRTARRPDHGVGPLEPGRADLLPALLTLVIALILTTLPLLLNHSYYFTDDTAGGAYGQWYELGQQLRAGHWPMLSLESWMAGNHIAEGQWGLYNPVVWAISLVTTVIPHPALVAAGVKLFFLGLAALGVYFLTRSYGARRSLAVLAGISAPVAGWTLYMDATAWVTNLEVWAYFPWTLWAVRRVMHHRRGMLIALVSGLLLVTVGYVQGTVMLVLMFVALVLEAMILRRWAALGRVILVGIPMGLMAITVYLPGLLSSGVTVRADKVDNTGFMTLTMNGLVVSSDPAGRADLSGWWGRYPNVPYTYVAWFLPLMLLAAGARMRALAPRLTGLLVFGGIALAFTAGPSQLGPLRFPIRSFPWVALVLIVLAAVMISRTIDVTRVRAKLTLVIVAVAFAGWLSYSAVVHTWRIQIVFSLLCAALLVAYALSRMARGRGWRRLGAVGLIVATMGISALQTRAYVEDVSAFGVTGFPTELSTYRSAVDDARGELIAVGDPKALGTDRLWGETLWGSTWYLSDVPAANAYSPTGYTAFNTDLCMNPYYGATCPELADKLFTVDPTTGARLVDLLSLDTVQILADGDRTGAQLAEIPVPEGWQLADHDDLSVTWTRVGDIAPVGGPTWTTPGLEADVQEQDANHVRMRVSGVPADGGQIVLSRLDWPGYRIEGAAKADALRGYLLTLDVPAGTADGAIVDVTFRPPGWELELACLAASLLLGAVLVVGSPLLAQRRRRREGAAGSQNG